MEEGVTRAVRAAGVEQRAEGGQGSSYTETAAQYVRQLTSLLPSASSLWPNNNNTSSSSNNNSSNSSTVTTNTSTTTNINHHNNVTLNFHRCQLLPSAAPLLVATLLSQQHALAWADGDTHWHLLLSVPLQASAIVPLPAPLPEALVDCVDRFAAHRPCFATVEGSVVSIRGAPVPSRPVAVLKYRDAVDRIASCPRGLAVLSGGRVTLHRLPDLQQVQAWDASPFASFLAASHRWLAIPATEDSPAPQEDATEDPIQQSLDAARAARTWVEGEAARVAGQGCVRVVDMVTGEQVALFRAHKHHVSVCCWGDSDMLYTASDGHTVAGWQLSPQVRGVGRLRRGFTGARIIDMQAHGDWVAATSERGTHHLWRGKGQAQHRLKLGAETTNEAQCCTWSARGGFLYTLSGGNGTLLKWRVASEGMVLVEECVLGLGPPKPLYICPPQIMPKDSSASAEVAPDSWRAQVEIRTCAFSALRSSSQFSFVVKEAPALSAPFALSEYSSARRSDSSLVPVSGGALALSRSDEPLIDVSAGGGGRESGMIMLPNPPAGIAASPVLPLSSSSSSSPGTTAFAPPVSVASPAPSPVVSMPNVAPSHLPPASRAPVAPGKGKEEEQQDELFITADDLPSLPPVPVDEDRDSGHLRGSGEDIFEHASQKRAPKQAQDEDVWKWGAVSSSTDDENGGAMAASFLKHSPRRSPVKDGTAKLLFGDLEGDNNDNSNNNNSNSNSKSNNKASAGLHNTVVLADYEAPSISAPAQPPQSTATFSGSPEAPLIEAPVPASPSTRQCSRCLKYLPRNMYSNSQWRKSDEPRCKNCVRDN